MEEKTTFGKFINQKRKQANLTQKELAEMIHVTESAVSKWERGISYPDITLVSTICDTLHVTEHELITASEDFRQREIEKQARGFRTIKKSYLWTFYLCYGISLIACFICNLAIQHTLSWFFIVLTSEVLAFTLTCVPVLFEKRKGLWTLGLSYLSLNLLLFVCWLYTGGGAWLPIALISLLLGFCLVFLPLILRSVPLPSPLSSQKTLICFVVDTLFIFLVVTVSSFMAVESSYLLPSYYPNTLYAILLPWICMVIIRYLKINAFFKTSLCLFVSGIYTFFADSAIRTFNEHVPFMIPQVNFQNWTDNAVYNANILFLILITFTIIALFFLVGGIVWTIKKQSQNRVLLRT